MRSSPDLASRCGRSLVVFQVLPHTLGLGPEVWRVLDKCHSIRNLGEYEGLLDVDDRIVEDQITAVQAVAAALRQKTSGGPAS